MILSGFLYHIKDEARTYAVIRKVFHSVRNNYLDNFTKCYEHVDELVNLIQLNILDLYEHLTELGVDFRVICFPWILSLMSVVVPLDSLHLVYEGYLKEGWSFIYRLGLAVFLYHK